MSEYEFVGWAAQRADKACEQVEEAFKTLWDDYNAKVKELKESGDITEDELKAGAFIMATKFNDLDKKLNKVAE